MIKNHLTVIIILLLHFSLWGLPENIFEGQIKTTAVEGRVVDENSNPLMSATVVLLEQKDSVIAKFSITDEHGRFSLAKIPAGDYILQVTYISYAGHSENISISEGAPHFDMGDITMIPASASLDEVIIQAEHIPMVINGDTLEYNSAAFKVAPNAAVEDLLKKLPGVEVARDGSIKAQGETITKVLVDGKEFFGDDPTIATKNLPADAVEKVQVFDKKSDIAEFSGIDDGLEQKTINLKLKDGKKHGYFGNVEGGYGTDNRYDGKFNINRFGRKAQISAIGMSNNINKQGFSFNDYIGFMGGMGSFMSGGGASFVLEDGDIPLSMNGKDGLSNIHASGINLNSDLSKKTTLNTSYFFNRTQNILDRSVFRQSLIEEQDFTSISNELQKTIKNNHRLSITLKHKIDSSQNLNFKVKASFGNTESDKDASGETFSNTVETESIEDYHQKKTNFRLNSSLTYLRRFRKKGRLFTADASFQTKPSDQNSQVSTVFKNLINTQENRIRQRQTKTNNKTGFGGKLTYTEPLGKYKYLQFNLARQQYRNTLEKDFYDIINNQEQLNEGLGNAYNVDYIYQQVGVVFRYNRKKANFTSGLNWQQAILKGNQIGENNSTPKKFLYLLPEMTFNYDFKPTKNISFSYRTNATEPTIRQLQPVIDNSSPLRIYKGNPALKPEYGHNLSAFFMSYDQFNFTNFFIHLMANYTQDKIHYSQTIDELLITTAQPINVDNDFQLTGSSSFSAPIRPIKSKVNLDVGITYNQRILSLNNQLSKTNTRSTHIDINFDNRQKNIVDITLGAKFRFNNTSYPENGQFDQEYTQQTYYTDLVLNIGKNWKFNSSFDYQVYSNESFGTEKGVPLWKAGCSRYVMKKKGEIKFSAHDLLNKNIGIKRTSALNYTQEERILSLGQYFMISFAYSISGFDKHSGIHMSHGKKR